MAKSTVEEIRRRFDCDVERFSQLETGQSATIDAPLALSLVAEAAAAVTPHASDLLDVGCGAGNFTLKLLERTTDLNVTLVDLSRPMLDRAVERIRPRTAGGVRAVQADIRGFDAGRGAFDVVLAAAVLHHLRTPQEWKGVFQKLFAALRPGGSLWIFDLVESSLPAVEPIVRRRYGDYLAALRDEAYRDHVFDYIEREDTPRSLVYQLDLLRTVGFAEVEVLHKHACFAAFGGVKRDST
jgi:tRNA (cmo5U34)-methyltransferase